MDRMAIFIIIILVSFNSYAEKSCTVDPDKIQRHPALVNFKTEIFRAIDRHIIEQAEGKRAQRDLSAIRESGFLDPSQALHLERETQEGDVAAKKEQTRSAGNSCRTADYQVQVYGRVKELCKLSEAEASCQLWGQSLPANPNDTYYDQQTLNDKGGSKRHGISETLSAAYDELEVRYQEIVIKNQSCDNTISSSLLRPSCQSAYQTAFNELPRQEIVENCKILDVENLGVLIVGDMAEFATRSCEVMANHVGDKGKERMVYNRKQKFKRSIACLNHIDPSFCREQRSQRRTSSVIAPPIRGAGPQ